MVVVVVVVVVVMLLSNSDRSRNSSNNKQVVDLAFLAFSVSEVLRATAAAMRTSCSRLLLWLHFHLNYRLPHLYLLQSRQAKGTSKITAAPPMVPNKHLFLPRLILILLFLPLHPPLLLHPP